MERTYLTRINSPDDLKKLAPEELPQLAREIREELLEIISATGGHLASNLGVVELTIALLYVFDVPEDTVVWDTGHQGYVYKLLTGRREFMRSLRRDDGCCGFLHREESRYDAYGAGHAGTAISAALGFAAARDRAGGHEHVLAVVGDGALGCGVSLEGLNNIIETTTDFILVLNDNRMSISPNVGALARYLSSMIATRGYNRIKRAIARAVQAIPVIGPRLKERIRKLEGATKSVLVPGGVFQELGLRYLGPLDGHDLPRLVETFRNVKSLREPLVLHVLTAKGEGYEPAKEAPEVFHGTGGFHVESGAPRSADGASVPTFSSEIGRALTDLAERDERVVAITAGMCQGTGLNPFRERHAKRLFDVGITEEHAVVFAGGMAAAGLRPFVVIYASFMQRAMDYVYHDVCLQNLPVVFCLDRAGVVADGPTHHGILDIGFWRTVPGLTVLQPADGPEMEAMVTVAVERGVPVVIRYPKANADPLCVPGTRAPLEWGKAEILREGTDLVVWAVGREAELALEVADTLATEGISVGVVNTRFVLPFDRDLLDRQLDAGLPIAVLENHTVEGGFGSIVRAAVCARHDARIACLGWPHEVIPWGTERGIRARYGLDAEGVAGALRRFVGGENP